MKKIDVGARVDVTSRLSKAQAKKVLSEIFNSDPNLVSYSGHCRMRMSTRELSTGDILNVLKAGKIHGDPEFENGSWRYRVETNKFVTVIAFRKPNHVVVVTAWRKK